MYDYDSLTANHKFRYGRFWRDRYDYMCQQMPPLLLYAWHERIVVKPTTTTVRLPPGDYVFDAISGIPFATLEVEEMGGIRSDEKRYDIFYADRLRWKRWNRKKTALLAKRGWNARVIYETE